MFKKLNLTSKLCLDALIDTYARIIPSTILEFAFASTHCGAILLTHRIHVRSPHQLHATLHHCWQSFNDFLFITTCVEQIPFNKSITKCKSSNLNFEWNLRIYYRQPVRAFVVLQDDSPALTFTLLYGFQ